MAVLVVPVNLTSVSDDDAMQLQQIGRRVAIIRGAMTNVAEFQVLPAMTMESSQSASSRAIETDIRQIVSIAEGDGEGVGPTIQITPTQMIMNAGEDMEILQDDHPNDDEDENDDDIVEIPVDTPAELEDKNASAHVPITTPVIPADPPKKMKPKLYTYIEAIRCGRCLAEFDHLLELSRHQKTIHQMSTIKVSQVPPVTNTNSELDSQQLLSVMEDKIAARLEKGEAARAFKRAMNATGGSRRGGGAASRGRGGKGGTKTGNKKSGTTKGNDQVVDNHSCLTCGKVCSDWTEYSLHMQSHQDSGGVGDVNSVEVFATSFSDLVQEVHGENIEDGVKEEKAVKYSIVKTEQGRVAPPSTTAEQHIITDASGNQIVVHTETPEQLQELLVSLGNGSLQMINGSGVGRGTVGAIIGRELSGDGSASAGEVYMIEEMETGDSGGVDKMNSNSNSL